MDRTYFPVLLLLGFVVVNAVADRRCSRTSPCGPGPPRSSRQPYESGIPPLGDARERFSVKFYMVAMLFIIFDIETVFMIPWGGLLPAALVLRAARRTASARPGNISFFGLGEMLVFMAILLVGFVYVWKKGALQWD